MKNLKDKVSVIVTCYNYGSYIEDCLNSVKRQTFKNFECVIVNDGSIDNTEIIVKKWTEKDERFFYHFQKNSGVSNARNTGIKLCTGKYILPLDADDVISENYIEECYKLIIQSNQIKIVYGASYILGTKKKWNLAKYNFDELLYKNMIHNSALYRKKDYVAAGGYDEKMREGLEDWEFWIRMLKDGGEVKMSYKTKFFYRFKTFSLNRSVIANSYGYEQRVYIFNKHKDIYIKSNLYDLFYENYNLKKKLKDPLSDLKNSEVIIEVYRYYKKKIFDGCKWAVRFLKAKTL